MSKNDLFSEEQSFHLMEQWLKSWPSGEKKFQFEFILIEEKNVPNIKFLQEKCLFAYRDEASYRRKFKCASQADIEQYIIDNVIPKGNNQIEKNVQRGDFGEIVVALIAKYFYNHDVFPKLKFKLNSERSAFGTDVISFDDLKRPTEIIFYESKVKDDITQKISVEKRKNKTNRRKPQFISVVAYESLSHDFSKVTHPMLDFIAQRFEDDKDYDSAELYMKLSTDYKKIKYGYEIFIFTNKTNPLPNYNEILEALNTFPIRLNPLKVSIVFLNSLSCLIDNVWKGCAQRAVELYEK